MIFLFRFFLLCFFTVLFVNTCQADTYPAKQLYSPGNGQTYTTHQATCSFYNSGTNTSVTSLRSGDSYPLCKITDTTNGSITYLSTGAVASCPYGGTLSGSWPQKSCINAPACPTGQVRDSITGQCKRAPLNCSSSEYDDGVSTSCTQIPNCNTGQIGFGSYFDVVTKQCSVSQPSTICIDGGAVQKFYCQPVDDCLPVTTICSNNSDFVEVANNNKQIELSKAREAAIDAQLAAATAETLAAKSLAEKQAQQRATEEQLKAAGEIALNPNSTQEQQAQARLDYEHWLKQEAIDKAQAKNAWDAYEKAKLEKQKIDEKAQQQQAETRPGNATTSDQIAEQSEQLKTSVRDVISGDGDGNGPGTGVRAGLPTDNDKLVGAIDESASSSKLLNESIKTSIDGVKTSVDGVKTSVNGVKTSVDGVKTAVDGVKDAITNQKTDCEKNPTHVSCMESGEYTPAPSDIPTSAAELSFTGTSWGSSGSCPVDTTATLAMGGLVSFSYAPICTFLSNMAPILILVSLMGAAYIVLGVKV